MIIISDDMGYCGGVSYGVNKAMDLAVTEGGDVFLLGELVNNSIVIENFVKKGFIIAENESEITENSTVFIRAHGVGESVLSALKKKTVNVIDCTCKNVKKVHDIVSEMSGMGYTVLIIGKTNHPEVAGIAGWCSGDYFIIQNEDDLSNIGDADKVCVVTQTTYSREKYERLKSLISAKIMNAVFYDTLCPVMFKQQNAAVSVAEKVDLMIVLGDMRKSSNSKELAEVCRKHCERVYAGISLKELLTAGGFISGIRNACKIGITASASTPAYVVEEVCVFLQLEKFNLYLETAKKEIEQECYNSLQSFHPADDDEIVKNALFDLTEQNEGGKRIRGALIKLGKEIADGKENTDYLPLAAAYEIFQTSILIHDDIIDKADMRRGKSTIHKKSFNSLNKGKDRLPTDNADSVLDHFANSRALCIGDYGFFISYAILSGAKIPDETLRKIFSFYSEILIKTCQGELMDVVSPFEKSYETFDSLEKTITEIYERKTAWYTIAGPLCLGAIMGGAGDVLVQQLQAASIPLGIAFQIKDDLLGIYSTDDKTGKPALSDIREKKQTTLYAYAKFHATEDQLKKLEMSYGNNDAVYEDLQKVREIFDITGAKKYAEEQIAALSAVSLEVINNANPETRQRELLNGLVYYLLNREF